MPGPVRVMLNQQFQPTRRGAPFQRSLTRRSAAGATPYRMPIGIAKRRDARSRLQKRQPTNEKPVV
jgi:hypothetical protein